MFDLGSAATEMSRLVAGVRGDQLDDPTPCSDWTVADLLSHIHQFTAVFTANACKEQAQPPGTLVDAWREAIPEQLDDLARAWREGSAWQGRVSTGGVEMEAADNAVVAIEELTVHGWDLARATGQHLHVADASLDQVDRFFELFGGRPFGPSVAAPESATRLEETVAPHRTGPVVGTAPLTSRTTECSDVAERSGGWIRSPQRRLSAAIPGVAGTQVIAAVGRR